MIYVIDFRFSCAYFIFYAFDALCCRFRCHTLHCWYAILFAMLMARATLVHHRHTIATAIHCAIFLPRFSLSLIDLLMLYILVAIFFLLRFFHAVKWCHIYTLLLMLLASALRRHYDHTTHVFAFIIADTSHTVTDAFTPCAVCYAPCALLHYAMLLRLRRRYDARCAAMAPLFFSPLFRRHSSLLLSALLRFLRYFLFHAAFFISIFAMRSLAADVFRHTLDAAHAAFMRRFRCRHAFDAISFSPALFSFAADFLYDARLLRVCHAFAYCMPFSFFAIWCRCWYDVPARCFVTWRVDMLLLRRYRHCSYYRRWCAKIYFADTLDAATSSHAICLNTITPSYAWLFFFCELAITLRQSYRALRYFAMILMRYLMLFYLVMMRYAWYAISPYCRW